MNPSRSITTKIEWKAIKEAMSIIERVPELQIHLKQLGIISKYADELKRTIKYEIEQENRLSGCCGEV